MATNNNPFADFFKAFTDSVNGSNSQVDFEKVISEGRKNVQTISDATKSASEGAQAIARRQVEIAQKSAEDASQYLKDAVASANSPEAAISQQAQFTKATIEASIANARELAEMASKSNAETFDLFNSRITQALNEWTTTFTKKPAAAKKKEAA